MLRVTVTLLPKRSVTTNVSIDPPAGNVRVDEKAPSWSCRRGASSRVRVAARVALPVTVTIPPGNEAFREGEVIKREGPARSGHAFTTP
jgi:hypothetical protein